MSHCTSMMRFLSFHSSFLLLNFIGGGGLQRQMADMNGWGMNRIEMHDIKDINYKRKIKK